MPQHLYCWRCDRGLPMLDEDEWAHLAPLLHGAIENIQRYRQQHGVALSLVPIPQMYWAVSEMHALLCGEPPVDPVALWHHRLSDYGPPCTHCGKPLRTPRAKLCAACGRDRAPPLPD
jgi:hypothetical protein